MKNKNWIYGLIIFLAQTCNLFYSSSDLNKLGDPIESIELEEDLSLEIQEDLRIAEEENVALDTVKEVQEEFKEEMIFKMRAENIPGYSGCIGINDFEEKNECNKKNLLSYIYQNIDYPDKAKANGIEGEVVVQFMIGIIGEVINPKIIQDIGGGCGEEVLRVVSEMPNRKIVIKSRGNPVKIQYTFSIKFKL